MWTRCFLPSWDWDLIYSCTAKVRFVGVSDLEYYSLRNFCLCNLAGLKLGLQLHISWVGHSLQLPYMLFVLTIGSKIHKNACMRLISLQKAHWLKVLPIVLTIVKGVTKTISDSLEKLQDLDLPQNLQNRQYTLHYKSWNWKQEEKGPV